MKNNWEKRIIAGLLSVSMVLSQIPSAVFAEESGIEQNIEFETEETVAEAATEANSEADVSQMKDVSAFEETEIEKETKETEEVRIGSEKESSAVDSMEVCLTLVETYDNTYPLSLDSLNDSSIVNNSDGSLDVINGRGLVLLSNVNPAEYYNKNIKLTMNESNVDQYDLTSTVTLNSTTYNFMGLGNSTYPYKGQLTYATSSEKSWMTTKALFNSLSPNALLPNITFVLKRDQSLTVPLLANEIVLGKTVTEQGDEREEEDTNTQIWNIGLLYGANEEIYNEYIVNGLIGTLETGNIGLNLSNNMTGTVICRASDTIGLFCKEMKKDTQLTASLSGNTKIKVESTENGDAGGFVGTMKAGSRLYVSGCHPTIIKSKTGDVGGIVGSAQDAMIQPVAETSFTFQSMELNKDIETTNERSIGGLVGYYLNTQNTTFDLSGFSWNNESNIIINGLGRNVGGVFGSLHNNNNFTMIGKTVIDNVTSTAEVYPQVSCKLNSATMNYGGLIGAYRTANPITNEQGNPITDEQGNVQYQEGDCLTASLCIKNVKTRCDSSNNTLSTYGGVIGTIPYSCYVEIENVNAQLTHKIEAGYFGGVIGRAGENGTVLLNIGSVALAGDFLGNESTGGLVGNLAKGIVRLYGTTDLSGMDMNNKKGSTIGQIVGKNGDGLVYAVGTGNSLNADGTGWLLKRYSAPEASDIGNWGAVVRLNGSDLKESIISDATTQGDDNTLFEFDREQHTITICGNPKNTFTISNKRDFAAYALAFAFSTEGESLNPILLGADNVKVSENQSITIVTDVDLTNTGVLGIGRDNGQNAKNQYFKGYITGIKNTSEETETYPTITLDIGNTAYGQGAPSDSKGFGGFQVYESAHSFLGLLPVANDTSISNLKIAGSIKGFGKDNKNKRIAAAVSYGCGNLTFSSVEVSSEVSSEVSASGEDMKFRQAGFIGDVKNSAYNLSFDNCSWNGKINCTAAKESYIGGLIGYVQNTGNKTININGCTLSGKINVNNPKDEDVHIGGLIAEFQSNGNNSLSISGLVVDGVELSVNKATKTCGGFLGYSWPKTNVTFENSDSGKGVTIRNSKLYANKAVFGGLVYQATGYWNGTATGSIKFDVKNSEVDAGGENGSVSVTNGKTCLIGGSAEDATSGLLIGTGLIEKDGLYLELGEWGENKSYEIKNGAVDINIGTGVTVFDEIIGKTIKDNAGHENAVVSLAVRKDGSTASLDSENLCNTYTSQLGSDTSYTNKNTRYYYNLDGYRSLVGIDDTNRKIINLTPDDIDSEKKLVLWSVSQYASGNLEDYFIKTKTSKNNVSISGSIALSGYSYYPVTPHAEVSINGATITFDNETFENVEEDNKKPSESNKQHYLIHYGLLYKTGSSVTVTNTTFAGSVGKGVNTSGALIYDNISGDKENKRQVNVIINNLILDGLCVVGAGDAAVSYAPLLINTIGSYVTLSVDTISTTNKYNEGEDTKCAATSLFGNVGDENATNIGISFSNIGLDARKNKGDATDLTLENWISDGKDHKIQYHTYRSIFKNATLLESFCYKESCNGAYNFNKLDDKVTFGVEISNTDTGRNQKGQYYYYDDISTYVWDGQPDKPAEGTISTYYNDDDYLRYVHEQEDKGNSKYELDINQRMLNLDKGCGTYDDPYHIEDGGQLIALANYLQTGSANNWVVTINETVYNNKKHNVEHNSDDDSHYMIQGTAWLESQYSDDTKHYVQKESGRTKDNSIMKAYLRNSYYQIKNDIVISGNYLGIGGSGTDSAFSGVIVGESTNNSYPTVYIACKNQGISTFGGLIRYSQGSVVKDLTISYAGGEKENGDDISSAQLVITNDEVPHQTNGEDYNAFFGGVVGYCMGGDTIIDNVSVLYNQGSVQLGGELPRLIAAGGYVGLVGGAREYVNGNFDERKGGGVVFRNMASLTNGFSKTLGDSVKEAQQQSDVGTDYYYCNPYVGRVLDGYACYDSTIVGDSTTVLVNTDKNYTIPTLTDHTGLNYNVTDNQITVHNAQGLWVLSAIVNSGAGTWNKTYYDGNNSIAYKLGKSRSSSCDYNGIGTSTKELEIKDEDYWGGYNNNNASNKQMAYLVNAYLGEFFNVNSGIKLILSENGTYDMSGFGNGFRGIGGSYCYYDASKFSGRALQLSGIEGNNATIKLKMQQHDYIEEDDFNPDNSQSVAGWGNNGAGLFVSLYMSGGTISNFTIKGIVAMDFTNASDGDTDTIDKKYPSGWKRNEHEKRIEGSAGGFCVKVLDLNSGSITFDGVKLEELTVSSPTDSGGLIARLYDGKSREWVIKNWKISNLSVTAGMRAGGLIGRCETQESVKIYGDTEKKGENIGYFNTGTIYSFKPNSGAGSLIGYAGEDKIGKTVTIEGTATTNNSDDYYIHIQNVSVEGTYSDGIGGIVGRSKKLPITIQRIDLDNVSVKGKMCTDVGGVLGAVVEKSATITDINITGPTVVYDEQKDSAKEVHVGGMVGSSYLDLTISNCKIQGTENTPIKILNGLLKDKQQNSAGGLVGYFKGKESTTTVEIGNCMVKNTRILSGDVAGGMVGCHEKGILKISNATISNSCIAIPKMETAMCTWPTVGGLIGWDYDKVYGFNLLSNQNLIGYTSEWVYVKNDATKIPSAPTLLSIMNNMSPDTIGLHNQEGNKFPFKTYKDGAAAYENVRCAGRWIGQREKDTDSSKEVKFVAVSCKGEYLPLTEVGIEKPGITYRSIVYADYPAVKCLDESSNPGNPFVVVNPRSDVLVMKDSETAETSFVLTGNGVGYTVKADGTVNKDESVAKKILQECGNTSSARLYQNILPSIEASSFLDEDSPVYISSYRNVETDTNVKDFPLVVINTNDNDEVNDRLWNYIAAMTNVEDAVTAKKQVKNIETVTYRWVAEGEVSAVDGTAPGSFVATQDKASLEYSSNQQRIRTNGRYDNTLNQITVLDVQYKDPTDSDNLFHLYVPTLVRKMLNVKVSVSILEGTKYYSEDYKKVTSETEETDKIYATADFGENVTAYIEYNYKRSLDEWQTSLDEGENLLWYYKKQISLYDPTSSNEPDKFKLPAGTKLTLLNKRTGDLYTHELIGDDIQAPLDFAAVFGTETHPWKETPICDLLNISAKKNNTDGLYVQTDENSATVKAVNTEDGQVHYYRPKDVDYDEEDVDLYSLTVGNVTKADDYLIKGDCFYLTISLPETTDRGIAVNNMMLFSENRMTAPEGILAPPTEVNTEKDEQYRKEMQSRYCIYDGVQQQDFSVSTSRIDGGSHVSGDDSVVMANGDSIQITLQTTLKLNDDEKVRNLFKEYPPKTMYQQFVVDLKRYIKNQSPADVSIEAQKVTLSEFKINNEDKTAEIEIQNGRLLITYGGTQLPLNLKTAAENGGTLVIKAVATLHYEDVVDQNFPQRGVGDTESGIGVSALSRVSNRDTLLTIANNKETGTDHSNNRYYLKSVSSAILHYNTIQTEEGTGSGDVNTQLGINPSDMERNTMYVNTVGNYDYSGLDEAMINRVEKIRYKLELYQKDQEGHYIATTRGLNVFWNELFMNNDKVTLSENNSIEIIDEFVFNPSKVCSIPIQFSVKTGEELENAGLTYANYKVRLTAVLLGKDDSGNVDEIEGTEASDYIIYTNARIFQDIVPS